MFAAAYISGIEIYQMALLASFGLVLGDFVIELICILIDEMLCLYGFRTFAT